METNDIPNNEGQEEDPARADRLLRDFHEHEQRLLGPDGRPFEVPAEGSLGLLALGYRGLAAWRSAKRAQGLAADAFSQELAQPEEPGS